MDNMCTKLTLADFKKDEKIIFFSSSTTHCGYYFMDLQQIHALNLPEYPVKMINGGISGGSARSGMERIEFDILAQKPDRVFISFGMNDVNYPLYYITEPDASNLAQREEAVENYRKYMIQCIETLSAHQVKIVLVIPPPYDEYASAHAPVCAKGVNKKALSRTAVITEELAEKYQLPLIDLYHPMLELIRGGTGILYSNDRVHPNRSGQYVMTVLYLKTLNGTLDPAQAVLDARSGVIETCACKVKCISGTDELSFSFLPEHLPFLGDKEAMKKADALYPVSEFFGGEKLVVRNLSPGKYRLEDEKAECLGCFTAEELSEGIQLSELPTANRKKAEKIRDICSRLRLLQIKLRDAVMTRLMIKKLQECSSIAEEFSAVDEWLATKTGEGPYLYYKSVCESFKANRRVAENIHAAIGKLQQELYKTAVPEECMLTLKRTDQI